MYLYYSKHCLFKQPNDRMVSMATITQVYLICIWQEDSLEEGVPPSWRAWIEEPRSSQRWGFDTTEALLTFLETLITEHQNMVSSR